MSVKKISLFVLPFFLTACTDNGILFRSNGIYENKGENIIYMLGDSYQVKDKTYYPQEDYTYIEEGVAGWFDYDEEHPVTMNGEKYQSDVLTAMHKTLPLPSIVQITNLENNKTAFVRVNERGPMVNDRLIDVSKKAADVLEFNKEGTTKVLVEIMPKESKKLKEELLKKEAFDVMKNTFFVPNGSQKTDELLLPLDQEEIIKTPQKKLIEQQEQLTEIDNENEVVYSYKNHIKQSNKEYVIQVGAFKNIETVATIQKELEAYLPYVVEKQVNGTILNCVQISGFSTKQDALNLLDKIHRSGYPDARLIK